MFRRIQCTPDLLPALAPVGVALRREERCGRDTWARDRRGGRPAAGDIRLGRQGARQSVRRPARLPAAAGRPARTGAQAGPPDRAGRASDRRGWLPAGQGAACGPGSTRRAASPARAPGHPSRGDRDHGPARSVASATVAPTGQGAGMTCRPGAASVPMLSEGCTDRVAEPHGCAVLDSAAWISTGKGHRVFDSLPFDDPCTSGQLDCATGSWPQMAVQDFRMSMATTQDGETRRRCAENRELIVST